MLSRLATCKASHKTSLLYLWLIGSVLNDCKVPKYYDQGCSFMYKGVKSDLCPKWYMPHL